MSCCLETETEVRPMDLFVEKSDLLKELNFVRSAVEKRNTIPILSHFLLEAEGLELKITATDLEIGARTTCPSCSRARGSGSRHRARTGQYPGSGARE